MTWREYEDKLFAEELKRLESAMGPNALPKGAPKASPPLEMPGAQFECNGPQGPQESQGFQGPQGYQCGFQAPCFGSQGAQGLDLAPPDFASPCFPSTANGGLFVTPTSLIGLSSQAYYWHGNLIAVAPTSTVVTVRAIIIEQRSVIGTEPSVLLIVNNVYVGEFVGRNSLWPGLDVYCVVPSGSGDSGSGYTGQEALPASVTCNGGMLSVVNVTNTYINGRFQ